MNKVEIADLIFWNNDNLFLMCNKSEFNGPVTWDLLNQIETSYAVLSHIVEAQPKKLSEFYDKLRNEEKIKIEKDEFCNLFKSKRIIYIAGYSEGFTKNTSSIYYKYIIKELYQKLNTAKYGLLIMNYKI